MISVDDEAFKRSLTDIIARVEKAAERSVSQCIFLVERNVKQNFVGQHPPGTPRPKTSLTGPYKVTGNLVRSVRPDPSAPVRTSVGVYEQSIYPRAVYSRRIELGFKGTDSLGRNYNQPAYPYFRPGVDDSIPDFETIFLYEWNLAMKG